jgi:broad specificity phosphatase PhoE
VPTWSFIRHGQSEANRGGWFAGHVDSPLTRLGETQAVAARSVLAAVDFTRAFASDLQRARRTAELLLQHTGVALQTTPALRERSCGHWERRAITEIEAAGDLATFTTWTGRPGGGESLRDTAVRALSFLAAIDDGQNTLVVAHGALLRATLGVLDGMDPTAIGSWRPANCELHIRDYPRGHFAATLARLQPSRTSR